MFLDTDKFADEESRIPRLIQCFSESREAPKDVSQNGQNEAKFMAVPHYFILMTE